MNIIKLSDRVKELSYTVGTGNLHLNGAVQGFSSFLSQYNYNDYLFYAVTDGTSYEVGSGQFILDGSDNAIKRFPFRSSNNNQIINFSQGIKEVYSTYPATHSVYVGSGVSDYNFPQNSGIAFWVGSNTLNYDNNIVWDKTNKRLGLRNDQPDYAIDIGGYGPDSIIKTSGIIIGSSGIYFPEANNEDVNYIGGRQLVHFEPNELGDANIQALLELSGVVDNILLLKQQNAGLVFAGPPSGCSPPCSPALPSFRPLILNDIEDLVDISGNLYNNISTLQSNLNIVSGIAQYGYNSSGILRNDLITVSGIARYGYDSSGILRTDLATVSGIARYGYDSSGILRTDLITVSGIAQYGYNSSGVLRTDLATVSGIAQYGYDSSGVLRTDLTTMSGIAQYGYDSSGVLNTKIYNYDIYDLGTIGGSVSLDWSEDKIIQTATLDGTATTFTKGTGWPSVNTIAKDLTLQLNVTSSTTITWTIIGSNWYNKPDSSTLASGEYMFLLRSFGSSDIYGFYIGENTGSL